MGTNIQKRSVGRLGELELLRFIFSVMIVYYHLTPILAEIFPNEPLYPLLTQSNGSTGANIVIAFFIISGVFFQRTLSRGGANFVAKKLIRLWPVLVFSLLANLNGAADIENLFFINAGMGVTTAGSSNPAFWYICVLFWISIVYFYLLKDNPSNPKHNIWLFILAIVMLSLLSRRQTSGLYSAVVSEYIPFLTNGVAMGIAGFSIGILFAQIKSVYKIKSSGLVLALQVITSGYCIYLHVLSTKRYSTVYYILIFLVALYFLLYQDGILTFRNSCFFHRMGAYSYSIYMMQFPCFHSVLLK